VLHAMLVGKGLKVFAELNTEYCKDYSKLKAALLNTYSVVSEVHRSRFRNRMKQPTETYSDFAFVLSRKRHRSTDSGGPAGAVSVIAKNGRSHCIVQFVVGQVSKTEPQCEKARQPIQTNRA